jgi:hypothetical protein
MQQISFSLGFRERWGNIEQNGGSTSSEFTRIAAAPFIFFESKTSKSFEQLLPAGYYAP